jgi:hypothetical protein
MAFGDSDDIKITISLDTEGAIKAAQDLKSSIENAIKATAGQFDQLQKASKQLATVLATQAKKEVSDTQQKLNEQLKATTTAANQEVEVAVKKTTRKISEEQKAQNAILKAEQQRIQAIKAENKTAEIEQKKAHTAALERIAELNLKRTIVRKTPRGELSPELGGATATSKALKELQGIALSVGSQFGFLTINASQAFKVLRNFGAPGIISAGVVGLKLAVDKASVAIDQLAQQAGKVEGLKTGFETLQRSIGQSPIGAIESLRKATQGLISDVELYQRANQAVLLGVPTGIFNEAAAAAVKLGRAMGIDAAFGLESLSLGLGRQSRLYLDNLGIVVSAEEAYRNFGATVGKSAADLDDAEKKAAFFAEALRKIKERADELPDPLDTVATAQTKANVAQENANRLYLEAFNNTSSLTEQYKAQQAVVEANSKNAQIYGAVLGELSAQAKGLALGFDAAGVIIKTAFAGALDFAFRLSPQKQFEDLTAKVKESEERIKELSRNVEEYGNKGGLLGLIARSNKREIDQLNLSIEEDNKKIERFKTLLDLLDGKNIKVNIDLSGIETAQDNIRSLFADLTREAEQQAGVFKIPGLPDAEAAGILSDYKAAKEELDKSLNKTEALDKFTSKLSEIEAKVKGAPIKEAAKGLATDISNIATAVSSGDFSRASEIFGKLGGSLNKVNTSARSGQVGLRVLTDAIEEVNKQINEKNKTQKKDTRDTISGFKKQQAELKSFTTSIRRSLERAIPDDFQRRLVDLFNDPTKDAQALADAIEKLGLEFKAAGGDVQAFIKEAGALKDLKDQMPGKLLPTASADDIKSTRQYNEELERAQSGSINLRDTLLGVQEDATGKKAGGAFFGFDLGFGDSDGARQVEQQLASDVQNVLATAFQAGVDGFTREDVPQIAAAIGTVIGGAIGAYFGGPAGAQAGATFGNILGQYVGQALSVFGKDKPGTRTRKDIDAYFSDAFDGDRLGVVIEGEVFKATQKRKKGRFGAIAAGFGSAIAGPFGLAVGAGVGLAIDDAVNQTSKSIKEKIPPTFVELGDIVFEGFTRFAGDVRFGIEQAGQGFNAFSSYFQTLPQDVQASFTGVGLAFGELLGVSEEQGRLIGTALANNIGGSLQNLQVLVMQTGESIEELGKKVIESFLKGKLTIDDAYNSIIQLQKISEEGIPGAIGAWEEAIDNFNNTIQANSPGLYLIDSFRDVASEAKEAGLSFEDTISKLSTSYGLGAEQTRLFFIALKNAGINSLDDLKNAGEGKLLSLLKIIKDIKNGIVTTGEQVLKIPIIPDTEKPKPTITPSGPKRKTPQELAKELLEKQVEEARKLTQASKDYGDIIQRINNGSLTRVQAGKDILALEKEILANIKLRDKFEKALNQELNKGSKGNAERIADLAKKLADVEEALKKAAERAGNTTREFKKLNISAVLPLIKDQNTLGLVARSVGVDLQKNVDILIKGFLQGRLSIAQVNDEIRKTKDLLGPGIPGAVGAVTDAFQNLINAGVQGGQFSTDAFLDIFAEFREKFNKEGSEIRKAQEKQLRANLDIAKVAYDQAIGPDALAAAKKTLDGASKALKDFYANVPTPELTDLRVQLEKQFPKEEIDKFFLALDQSGLGTFQDFEKAGNETIIAILGKLNELGFKFNQTSDNVNKVNDGLVDAEKNANAGLDPLAEAVKLVQQFNSGASTLPPVFSATTDAINQMNGPLTTLANGFQGLIEKLGELGNQTFENDVIFNVRTTGDAGGRALVELIFGDGSDISKTTGQTGGSLTPNATEIDRIKKELKRIERGGVKSQEKAKYNRLKNRLTELGG